VLVLVVGTTGGIDCVSVGGGHYRGIDCVSVGGGHYRGHSTTLNNMDAASRLFQHYIGSL
jgi:hypothetical protein